MTDLGDEEEVAEAARKLRVQQHVEQEELKVLLLMPAMRRFVWTLLCECGINNISFAGEATHETAFNEGQRNIGNKLIAMLDRAKAHTYMEIYTEFRKDEEEDD